MGQKFVQSDYPTQSGTQYPANIDADIKVMARLAASYNPCAEDTPSALKVVVQAGAMFVNGALLANASQTVTLAAAHATLPRIDRVVVDSLTGVASKIDGVANVSPVAPAITDGKLPVAQVLVTATMTIVANSAITDERVGFGGFASNKACAAGYTRVGPNLCMATGTPQQVDNGNVACTLTAAITGVTDAKAVLAKVAVSATANNAVAARQSSKTIYSPTDSSCAVPLDVIQTHSYEFVATANPTTIMQRTHDTIIRTNANGQFYVTGIQAAPGSVLSINILGYFD
jgi:hypothetical protein